jgi:hypothetical protein
MRLPRRAVEPGRVAILATGGMAGTPLAILTVWGMPSRVGTLGSRGGVPRGAADRAGHRDVGPASDEAGARRPRASVVDCAVGLRAEVFAEADSVLLVHVAGVDGCCAGRADRCCFALTPCPVARWARSVLETHGVAVWDARPTGRAEGLSLTPLDAGEAPMLSRVAV